MSYDPREHGAKCEQCPLKDGRVVPPELNRGSLMVVGEEPGREEELTRIPFTGPSGRLLWHITNMHGAPRESIGITNVRLCRPANEREAAQAAKACRDRLLSDLASYSTLLLLGADARAAVLSEASSEEGLMRSRGLVSTEWIAAEKRRVLSTVHPAFVLRSARWYPIFLRDVSKAVRLSNISSEWIEPEMITRPSPELLASVLSRLDDERAIVAYDTETDGLEPTTARLRCVGIGSRKLVVCVPFASAMPGHPDYCQAYERQRIVGVLARWFGDECRSVCAHNEQYDRLVMRHNLPEVEIKRRVFDTVVAHHVAWSELPHDLAFLAAQYTDTPAWKAADHDGWQSDEQLWRYNMLDVAITAECAAAVANERQFIEQKRVFEVDMRLSRFCRELHEVGMHLDLRERDAHAKVFDVRKARAQVAARAAAVAALSKQASDAERRLAEGLNAGSPTQVRDFLYEACFVALPPESIGGTTGAGDVSVARDVLFYLLDLGMPPEIEEFIHAVLDYREAQKLGGTYCRIEPMADGRVRSSWNPHVVVSGRLSCSNPNVMNVKGSLRSMWDAAPGHLLVACDKSQLELRVIAWLAQDERLIEAFLSGADVHKVNACSVLGIARPEDVSKEQRRFTKTFVYAVGYGAGAEKAHRMIKGYREEGKRPYSRLTLEQAEQCCTRWWNEHAAITRYHARNRDRWQSVGFIEEPIHGRRRYFGDGIDVEAMSNYPIQSCAAADVNDAVERVIDAYPWGFAGPGTGIVHYNYDSLMLEVPEGRALEVAKHVRQIMASKLGDMPLPTDAKVGKNWRDMREV